MAEKKPCRKDLMDRIHVTSFAADDAKLFLDTHPCDKKALEFFERYEEARRCALKEYAKYYGPLTLDSMDLDSCERWSWINEPWPWQEGGC